MDYTVVQALPFRPASLRCLVIAALAQGTSLVSPVPEGRDTAALLAILQDCGASVTVKEPAAWEITGTGGAFRSSRSKDEEARESVLTLNTGTSASLCRLLLPVLAAGQGHFHLRSADSLRELPLSQLLGALAMQGVEFDHEDSNALPLTMHSGGLAGGTLMVNLDESSQNLSALLLAAPLAREALTIETSGSHAVGWPYIALTLQCMQDFGAKFDVSTRESRAAEWKLSEWRKMKVLRPGLVRFRVRPGNYRAASVKVEGDWAAASALLAAGALGRPVTVRGLGHSDVQGAQLLHNVLQAFGAKCDAEPDAFSVAPAKLHGINADLSLCPDLAPAVAVLAAFAKGNTLLRGLENRNDAWEKFSALRLELGKSGIVTEAHPQGIVIIGDPDRAMRGRELKLLTHGDPYLASALLLLQLRGASVSLDRPALAASVAALLSGSVN